MVVFLYPSNTSVSTDYLYTPGVIGNFVKHESQLRSEVASLINNKLRMFDSSGFGQDEADLFISGVVSKGEANRMLYKSFDEQITRKHGIVVEGWPLSGFENPSSIGSQVELKVLLNAWQSDVARFRKMSEGEFMSWKAKRYGDPAPLTPSTHPNTTASSLPGPSNLTHVSSSTSLVPTVSFVQFDSATPAPLSGVQKKTRKTRSDKGKSRKRGSQIPGEYIFPTQ